MSTTSIVEAVKNFIGTCPLVSGGTLLVDFLPAEAATYSVDVVPIQPVMRRYLDGSTIRQAAFVLATRTYYGEAIRQQIDNLAFFEDFTDWIEAQNKERNFPDLGTDRRVMKMEVTTSGYVFAPDTETARYQIQIRFEFYQKG